ncbi:DUF6376 family protein [Oceanobacillus rekensis]|uniref:DUF6376 family protein n=1 Tax=Oceanobacillus rekensis TaxID=937927 RepID=UPI000B4438E1|nr:DUF6376 family protein [Oceanobacillus rekensis]
MKKIISFVLLTIVLTGCSIVEETNNTLNYATEATDYLNELSNFAEETSGLLNEATTDPAAKEELEDRLLSLEDSIKNFNNIEVPTIAEGIHQTITEKNQQLLDATNNVVQNGEVVVEQMQNSEIYQTIENITELKNQIEQLGF